MMSAVKKAGHQLIFQLEKAEIVIINTCGFIEDAQQEAVNTIIETGKLKRDGIIKYILATGCLPQRFGGQLLDELPELDGILGVGHIHDINQAILELENNNRPVCKIGAIPAEFTEKGDRVLTTPHGSAYLKITEGCDNHCSYCTIPSIRGGLRSRPWPELLEEAAGLVENGVRELVLIGQDTAVYGLDLYRQNSLPDLLKRLDTIEELDWIRLMYVHPAHLDKETVRILARDNKIIPYMDWPIQHVADRILKKMNRSYGRNYLRNTLRELRDNIAGLTLRTTVMVGFPGETEDEFKELRDFIGEAAFDWLGAFAFQSEEGTPASLMEEQIPEEIKNRRLDEILGLQKKITRERNVRRINSRQKILISSRQDKNLYLGRGYFQAPEVDGLTLVKSAGKLKKGNMAEVLLQAVRAYDMIGEVVYDLEPTQ
jgi:ribosomal protein S12 methylthiotransferase